MVEIFNIYGRRLSVQVSEIPARKIRIDLKM